MNDEERQKALECCLLGECKSCPIIRFQDCRIMLKDETISLLNRQQAEIERLQKTLDDVLDREPLLVERAEKYAIKEFAERLKKEAVTKCDWDNCVDVEDIDRLVAEMVGEQNA